MATGVKFYLVSSDVLPEVFLKVAEAKRLLSTGEVTTVNDAARLTGISRSAFYKYRDAVMPFQHMRSSRIITFQMILHDEPGALNNLLTILTDHRTNIMTINSSVPSNGSAVVTISAETANLTTPIEDLVEMIRKMPGVVKADIIAI